MNRFTLAVALFLTWTGLHSQITSYPYTQDFEAFPTSNQGSGAEPNPNAFPGGWSNVTADAGTQDWYAVKGSTPSGNTGPAGDHTTGSGTYLYVEDSGRDNEEVTLESPLFILAGMTNPTLAYWVSSDANLAGAAYGSDSSLNHLLVYFFDGTNTTLLDSVGALQTGWTYRQINLSGLTPNGIFRFVVNNNNYGDFIHDIAIDDVSVFDQPQVDGILVSARIDAIAPADYTLAPLSQSPAYTVSGTIRNNGINQLTNLIIAGQAATWQDTIQLDSLNSLEQASFSFNLPYAPTASGPVTVMLTADQNDTIPNNIRLVNVNDSTFARDDSVASGGLGFTGTTGIFGNMFELTQPDVLTSVSYFLNSSVIGDTLRVLMYGFGNDVPGFPDTTAIMDSSVYIPITSRGWHTATFTCQNELAPGRYFVAIEQVNNNNLGFGYDQNGFTPGTSFFGNGVEQWVDLATIPSLASAFMLRMNFGPETKHVQLIPATDRICVGDSVALSASGSGTYSWTGPGLSATTGSGVMAGPSATATYSVTMTDPNGCVSESSAEVGVNLHPVPVLSGDTLICSGSTSTLTASGGDQYLWSTGDTTATIQVNPGSAATFSVVVSDAIGCSASDSISVDLFPAATVAFDTTLAFFGQANGTATATASGGVPPYTFSWNINGTVQASATATGLAPGVYTVEVTDGNGCLTIDSVMVTEATAAIGKGLASAQSLTVSPNPASHQVILGGMGAFSPGESLEMELTDLQGRRVQSWTRQAAEELVLDISATVPEGVYQLMVYGRDHIAVTRLMVAR